MTTTVYPSSHLTDCKTIGIAQKTVLRSYEKKIQLISSICLQNIFKMGYYSDLE